MKTPVEFCDGKVIYDKKTAITARNLRMKESHQELRVYECEKGDHWHLTKQMRRSNWKP